MVAPTRVITPSGWVRQCWQAVFKEESLPQLASPWQCQWAWQHALQQEINALPPSAPKDEHVVLTGANTPAGARWLMTLWEEAQYTGQSFSMVVQQAQGWFAGDEPDDAIEYAAPLGRVANRFNDLVRAQSARPVTWYWQALVAALRNPNNAVKALLPTVWLTTEDASYWPEALATLPTETNVTCVPVIDTSLVAAGNANRVTAQVFDTADNEACGIAQQLVNHSGALAAKENGLRAVVVPPTPMGRAMVPYLVATLRQAGLAVWDGGGQTVTTTAERSPASLEWYRPLFWSVTLLQQAVMTRLAMDNPDEGDALVESAGMPVPEVVSSLLPEWWLAIGGQANAGDAPTTPKAAQTLWHAMLLGPEENKTNNTLVGEFAVLVSAALEQPPQHVIPRAVQGFSQQLNISGPVATALINAARFLLASSWGVTTVLAGLLTYYDEWVEAAASSVAPDTPAETTEAESSPVVVAPWPTVAGLPLQQVWAAGLTQQQCQQSIGNDGPKRGGASLISSFNAVVTGAAQAVVSYHRAGAVPVGDADTHSRHQSAQQVWPWLVQQGWFNATGQPITETGVASQAFNQTDNAHGLGGAEPVPTEPAHPWSVLPVQAPAPIWPQGSPIPLSATGIKTYMRCPRQFFYKQWLQLPSVGSAAMVFGRILHTLLEVFHRYYAEQKVAYTAAAMEDVWQQWHQLAEEWEQSGEQAAIPAPFTANIYTQWLWEPALVQAELNQLVGQTIEAMAHSGYFSRPPQVVVPEVSVKFTWPTVPNAEWIGTIDALFGYDSNQKITWDVIDFKHDNPAQWRQVRAASREKSLAAALAPLPQAGPDAPHAKRFKDVDKRNYQMPLYYAATQADTALHETLQQAVQAQAGKAGNGPVPPVVSAVGLQIVRAPIGEQNAAAAAQVACLQVMLPAAVVTSALEDCLTEVGDAVVQPLVVASHLAANPHSRCQQCDYRYLCPEGLAARNEDADSVGGSE